ncbi:hypothetical protein QIS74_10712 [Colletotrichum tabaci]|uniref:Uncharacterized protein n=1 Tax=Colletotrichum tabaci TaxID=1209068 RepID=A0AAV9T3G5_9PEZI
MGSPSGPPLRPRASSNFMGIRASGFPPSMTPQEKHLFSDRVNSATTRLSSTMAASDSPDGFIFVVYFHKSTAADALALLKAADIRVRGHEVHPWLDSTGPDWTGLDLVARPPLWTHLAVGGGLDLHHLWTSDRFHVRPT